MTYASGNRYFALGKIELNCFGLWEHEKLTKYADYIMEIILVQFNSHTYFHGGKMFTFLQYFNNYLSKFESKIWTHTCHAKQWPSLQV